MLFSNKSISRRIPLKQVKINDNFWNSRLEINNKTAIFYQWDQLEKTHNQDNFRILAGKKEGYRFGFFYCDSDLHKWTDAAARILTTTKNEKLSKLVQEYIDLMKDVQEPDGYLYTYNQFHFPDRRWANIQIEHEMEYKKKFLDIAIKSADLLVKKFLAAPPKYTPGHQEIEIALIRLYRLIKEKKYLDLASHLIYQRGRRAFFGLSLLSQARDQEKRKKIIAKDMRQKNIDNKLSMQYFSTETKQQKEVPLLGLRSTFQFLSGRYHQQNTRVTKMKRPYGHSVRWGYLVTAMAMLYQENEDPELLKALERTWEHLVQKQMFLTGGIGSLGTIEGFGRDYELDNSYCYCETCAAIANILLNWELALITNDAKYSDLLEWQLYNALNVGISIDGRSYLYRNLLKSNGQLTRKDWFATPCCPSNVSRIWANIGEYIYSHNEDTIWIHQFIGNSTEIQLKEKETTVKINMTSEFPWNGKVSIKIQPTREIDFTLKIRMPNWTNESKIWINGQEWYFEYFRPDTEATAGGLSPQKAMFIPVKVKWRETTTLDIEFAMDVRKHNAHPKVKTNKDKVALSQGPMVYCFESTDNPNSKIPNANINAALNITSKFDESLFGGVNRLEAIDGQNKQLIAIPYYCWANRDPSAMQVWINEKKKK
ncbi:MAG: glycoside hydrolase family 127 protein [Candidatus Heimdallarchaeota archaeon]